LGSLYSGTCIAVAVVDVLVRGTTVEDCTQSVYICTSLCYHITYKFMIHKKKRNWNVLESSNTTVIFTCSVYDTVLTHAKTKKQKQTTTATTNEYTPHVHAKINVTRDVLF